MNNNIYFIITILILLFLFGIYKTFKCFLVKKPKILIMVISKTGNHIRWNLEKDKWLRYFNPKENISFELIECDNNLKESFISKYRCNESVKPGIFQKTILSIQSNINEYDYFIRTNLSTFVIQKRLISYINKLKNKNVYNGVFCKTNENWIGGWGIILNKETSKILIKEAYNKQYFYNKSIPDDVLMGKILKDVGVKCDTTRLGYIWNYSLSIDENIKAIQKNSNAIFIRLIRRKILDNDEASKIDYLNALKKLYTIYV